MVSRYRDIIETNQTSLSRTGSILSTRTNNLRNGSSSVEPNGDSISVNDLNSSASTVTSNRNVDPDSQSVGGQSTSTEHTQYGNEIRS